MQIELNPLKWFSRKGAIIEGDGTPGNRLMKLTDPAIAGFFSSFGAMTPTLISVNSLQGVYSAWQQCPPLVSVITGKALADATGVVQFKWISGQNSGELVNLSSQLTARAMSKLLAKPNPLQSWQQFRSQQKIYTQLFGFCPVFAVKPVGFSGPESVKALWNIPPHLIKITTTGKLLFQTETEGIIKKIEVSYNGEAKELPVSDVFFLKDNYISINQDIIPNSRVSVLQYPISSIIACYKASNVLITKHGAVGILSNHSKDAAGPSVISNDDKKAIQEGWAEYGLSEELQQIIITSATLSWQQMAMPIKDLQLRETIQDGTMEICSVYNYPYELMPSVKGTTFTNKKEAKKSLYQDTIMPEADSDAQVYNDYFQLSDKGIVMVLDYSHLEVFQQSAKDKAEAAKALAEAAELMYKANQITLNRSREMVGEPTVAGDDTYFSETQQSNGNETTTETDTGGSEEDQSGA